MANLVQNLRGSEGRIFTGAAADEIVRLMDENERLKGRVHVTLELLSALELEVRHLRAENERFRERIEELEAERLGERAWSEWYLKKHP